MSVKDFISDVKKGTQDQVIANNMLAASKAAGSAYLAAAFECANPELRRLFFQFADQAVQGHGALTELAIRKDWYNAYESPDAQLRDWYDVSKTLVSTDAKM